ncbi:MAG: hypothetical protein KC933_25950 [Myxococcales bacterium]|nr:hypothetical protein [Myxococcales bacterium]MCB9649713.1 hypothetical protein [Deltaproteobacteria bacterium]
MNALPLLLTLAAAPPAIPAAVRPLGACVARSGPGGEAGFAASAFAQVFARYDARFADDADFNEFSLGRGELGACTTWGGVGGMLINLEAVRSAGPDSLFGVAGDSLVIRAKHAFAFTDQDLGFGQLTLQVGLVPDPWTQSIEGEYDLRGAAPTLAERAQFFDTSDLGATAQLQALEGRVGLRVAYLNGEGRNQIEQNAGKNLTFVLSGTPLLMDLAGPLQVNLHAGYRDGSLGAGKARNHRLFGALTALHPRAKLGVEWSEAFGYRGRGEVKARLIGAWASGALIDPYLGLYARYDRIWTDTSLAGAHQQRIEAGLYTDALSQARPTAPLRLRAYLGYARETFGAASGPLPGAAALADNHTVLLVVEALGWSPALRASAPENDDDAHPSS